MCFESRGGDRRDDGGGGRGRQGEAGGGRGRHVTKDSEQCLGVIGTERKGRPTRITSHL